MLLRYVKAGCHVFSCRSLLLSTTVLNDTAGGLLGHNLTDAVNMTNEYDVHVHKSDLKELTRYVRLLFILFYRLFFVFFYFAAHH